jgi:putative acetyltransferase
MSSKQGSKTNIMRIEQAATIKQIGQARELFQEYGASLGFSLCFQSFDKELAGLPGDYAPPGGRLLLAYVDNELAGCAALHRFEEHVAEMKRLYVRPGFRGQHIGQRLSERLIADARAIGYTSMRLDTIPSVMDKAIELYRSYGFHEIAPYRVNPIAGALYLEKQLTESSTVITQSRPRTGVERV